jgi:hypothetical protein
MPGSDTVFKCSEEDSRLGMRINTKEDLLEKEGIYPLDVRDMAFHPTYEVKNETGEPVGINLLQLYYGDAWEPALDRLKHQFDGYVTRIHHQGYHFKVYRKLGEDRR